MMRTQIKIIDFDFASHLTKKVFPKTKYRISITMEPKILSAANRGIGQVDECDDSDDIWSLGILCYEMLIGRSPFFSQMVPGIIQNVENGSYVLPLNLSKEVVSFLNGMIQYNSKKRLSANELARHYFLVKNTREFTPLNLSGKNNKVCDGKFFVNTKEGDPFLKGFSLIDGVTLEQVSTNLLVEQKNLNANHYFNNFNNIRDYFVPYNIPLGGFAQVQPMTTQNNLKGITIRQAVVNQYPVNQFNQPGLNNLRMGYRGIYI